jgi:hypothetical protein
MDTVADRVRGWVSLLALFLVGSAGSVWCFFNHMCIGGHMKHPPYPAVHYAADFGWALALIAIPLLARHKHLLGRFWWLTFAVVALPVHRFVFGSGGGYGVLGLPI